MTLNAIMCFDIWAKFIVLVPSGVTNSALLIFQMRIVGNVQYMISIS